MALAAVGLTVVLPSTSDGQSVTGTTIWTIAGSGPTRMLGGGAFFSDGDPDSRPAPRANRVALGGAGNLYNADTLKEPGLSYGRRCVPAAGC